MRSAEKEKHTIGVPLKKDVLIKFPDYSANELYSMLEKLCTGNDYVIPADVSQYVFVFLKFCGFCFPKTVSILLALFLVTVRKDIQRVFFHTDFVPKGFHKVYPLVMPPLGVIRRGDHLVDSRKSLIQQQDQAVTQLDTGFLRPFIQTALHF